MDDKAPQSQAVSGPQPSGTFHGPATGRQSALRRWVALLTLAVMTAAWFGGLGYRKLADPDEGRYAEIPREMTLSGDWVTPRLNQIKYFEKPPLQYWATAAAYKLFGFGEWTTRMWPAVTGLLGILLTWFAGRRLFGGQAGQLAALVLIGTPYYVVIGHIATLDMGVTFFLTAALYAFLLAQVEPAGSRRDRLWMAAAWACMGFAVLSKGLIGVVLPVLALVVYCAVQRDLSVWRRLHPVSGLALLLVVCAPWFVRVSLANPEFPGFFFLHEHFARFTSTVHHRGGPLWYFVPIVLLGMLPWIVVLGSAVKHAWRRGGHAKAFSPERFLLVWAACVFVFFSVSGSKLPAYVLPMVPALALLAGARMVEMTESQILRRVIPPAILGAILIFAANEVVETLHEGQSVYPLYEHYSLWTDAATLLILVTTNLLALRRRPQRADLRLFALVWLIAAQVVLTGFESLSPLRSAWITAQEIQPHLRPDTQVFSVGRYEQTLPPYLKRPVVLVAHAGELQFGIEQEPTRWLPTIPDFEREWRAASSAIALMNPASYEQALADGLPMEVISRAEQRVVVRKP